MSRRPARFTVVDLRRAIEAAKAAGGDWAVEIDPDGTIRVVPTVPKQLELLDVRQERRIVL